MASQNESNPESGIGEAEKKNTADESKDSRGVNQTTREQPGAPFSEFDPFRAARIGEVHRQTDTLLQSVHREGVGLENADEELLRRLYEDAEERASWSEARQDAFTAILRLGKPTPRRRDRIL